MESAHEFSARNIFTGSSASVVWTGVKYAVRSVVIELYDASSGDGSHAGLR